MESGIGRQLLQMHSAKNKRLHRTFGLMAL